MEHSRHPESRVGTKRHRVEEIVVEPAIEHVDALQSLRRTRVQHRIVDHEILALDKVDTHLSGEKGMLVIGGVVQAGSQYRDARGSHRGSERCEDRVQPLAVVRHLAHPVGPVELGKRPLHRVAAAEHVGHPGRHAKVVLEHRKSVVGTHEIGTAHRDVDVVENLDSPHFVTVLRAAEHQLDGHDPVAERPALVVDVLEEEIDGGEALLEPSFDVLPLPGGQQAEARSRGG